MGPDVSEAAVTLLNPCAFKVHHPMCIELKKLVDAVTKMLPDIEVARPRCSSGLQTLSSLNRAIEKAMLLLQHCTESSKLYLAITGGAILSRFQRSRNFLEQSLVQIQNIVPVMLAREISLIIEDLRAAVFVLDPSEEEAGKVMRGLLHSSASASDAIESSEREALQSAASRLQIMTSKAILIEKRSLKKLMDKVSQSDAPKVKILRYLLYLLKKYGSLIMEQKIEKLSSQFEESLAISSCTNESVGVQSVELESCKGYEQFSLRAKVIRKPTPPEEFKCPISMRLMSDPVVIASGQTFERMWIQKWLDEGNHTCPKTKLKLAHLSLTSNTAMKDLISKWCLKHRVTIQDPCMQSEAPNSFDTSSNSISSFGSSMNDLRLPSDDINSLFGSPDSSYCSKTSHGKITSGSSLNLKHSSHDHLRYEQSEIIDETDVKSLSRLSDLPWETQCKVVEDVKNYLKYNDQAFLFVSDESIVESLINFLKKAFEVQDVDAKRSGLELLLTFASQNSNGLEFINEDTFSLLSHLLDSEVTEQALHVMEVFSAYTQLQSKITSSGALSSLLDVLDSQVSTSHVRAIKTLQNLSSNTKVCTELVSLECIQKLVPFLQDNTLSTFCIIILRNLSNTDMGRVSLAETLGSISAIVELLEIGSHEEQEHAVSILLTLCSQCAQYCQMVMFEGVIPALVRITRSGNDNAGAIASELLRILRVTEYNDEQESVGSDVDYFDDARNNLPKETKPSSRKSRLFGMGLSIFSKSTSLVPMKKT